MNFVSRALEDQFAAALAVLNDCIVRCPDTEWRKAHGDYPFSQVAFHALFFADYYLDCGRDSFRNQSFHKEHAAFFADYEEFEDRIPVNLYEKETCLLYLRFCLGKARAVFSRMTEEGLRAPTTLPGKRFSNLELFIDTIRHIQHHAAQLGLRLQFLTGQETAWIGGGWKESAHAYP